MRALLKKELKLVFCSPSGAFFALIFLSVSGAILFIFDGSYNIFNSGYASMAGFFYLAPILLSVLIPALTMRQIAEEKSCGTLDILITRPLTYTAIYISKFIASYIFTTVTLLSTAIYVFALYRLANPVGNIDITAIVISYISLFLLVAVFIAIGLFTSALTRNQVVALIIAISINLFVFFGFDLLATLFISGKSKIVLSSFGLVYHYQVMQRGVIQLSDIIAILTYFIIFSLLSVWLLGKRKNYLYFPLIFIIICVSIISFLPNYRIDFTTDKRYTLNDYTKTHLKELGRDKKKLKVEVWLKGDLNVGFQRLSDAVENLLDDFNRYADNVISVEFKNPYDIYDLSTVQREMYERYGMNPTMLNEVDREGKTSQKLIYPYAQISNGSDTLTVRLLKNIKGYMASENLNASIESLEFEFMDAIRLLNQKEPRNIAFIEGHGELPRVYVYDAEEQLSKYYSINRGQIGQQVGILDQFSAIIIAGPTQQFSETEKYIIDQYIMSGGRVLWLIDGAYYSYSDLVREGRSASMKNDTNLDDLLFAYGVRINPDLIQDKQCVDIMIMTGDDERSAVSAPCLYMPLLMPSPDNLISKDISDVKASFASSLDWVNKSENVIKSVLLTTSGNTHIIKVPETIDFDLERIQNIPNYFDQRYIPIAISMEGIFSSAFYNRMIPDSIDQKNVRQLDQSIKTKMIVVSSSGIIRNDIEGQGNDSEVLPIGFDRNTGRIYGNRDFIVNALNWLTDDDGLMLLRTKKQQLQMLNKQTLSDNRNFYIVVNMVFPIAFILIIMAGVIFYRRLKYAK